MREDCVDVGGGMNVDAEQNIFDVLDRIDAVQVAGRDQRVEAGEVLAGLRVPDEEKVFPVMQSSA